MTAREIPDHDAWSAWHPLDLTSRLSGVSKSWCIVGGRALDLWHGHQTRDHDDLEFTVLREDVGFFRRTLRGLDFYTAGSGVVTPLPENAEPPANIAQIWCLDSVERRWRVDMMLEPGTPQTWVCKRSANPCATQRIRSLNCGRNSLSGARANPSFQGKIPPRQGRGRF
jgi:hypothetical protein